MALVHVPKGWVDAHLAQRAHTADAQHDLLGHPHLLIAAVEPRRKLAILRAVRVNVGVHQEQRDATDLDAIDLGIDRSARQLDFNNYLVTIGRQRGRGGHIGEIQLGIARLLPATGIEPLAKIALRVEEPDRHERQP